MRIILAPFIALYGFLIGCLIFFNILFILVIIVFMVSNHLFFVKVIKNDDVPEWIEKFSLWSFNGLDYIHVVVDFLFVGWRKLIKSWKEDK